ncbi:MAG: EamA family transporter [Candidatus ainarchaeum sp.]|nr:EamA family transporter [Candidatus ainarchaeum sp.]
MEWLILTLIATILFAITNYIDKYLVKKHFNNNIIGLIIISCFISILIIPIFYILKPQVIFINPLTAIILILNGAMFLLYLFPYFKSLDLADTNTVICLFQMIPIIGLILGWIFLKETITYNQLIACILIIFGTILISIDFKEIKLNKKVLIYMFLASGIICLNDLIFKIFAISIDFTTASFWQYTGYVFLGIILLILFKDSRKSLIKKLTKQSALIKINILNEIINIVGIVLRSLALLSVPIGIVQLVGGIQSANVFILGILFAYLIPNFFNENYSKQIIIQKTISLVIIFIGLIFLSI